MSPSASGVLPEKPRSSGPPVPSAHPRLALEKQVQPSTTSIPEAARPAPAPPAKSAPVAPMPPGAKAPSPTSSAQAMSLQSAYGNAALARAATSGELAPAPKQALPTVAGASAQPVERIAAAPVAAPATEKTSPISAAASVSISVLPVATTPPAPPPPSIPPGAAPPAVAVAAPAAAAGPAPPTPTAAGAPSGAAATPGRVLAAGPAVATAPVKGAPAGGAAAKPPAERAAVGAPGGAHEKGAAPSATPSADGAAGGKSARSAATDPAFQAVVRHSKAVAKHQATHAPAHAKAAEAHAAAVSPANEVPSRAAARQTGAMEQQKPKRFNREAFKASLRSKIKAPTTLAEADDFKEKNNLGEVKSAVNSQVAEQKQQSQGALPEKVAEKPDTSGIEPKPTSPLPDPGVGQGQPVGAAGAAPKPVDDADISLQAGPKEVDKKMADAGVTEEQLQQSNEPAFQSAAAEKKNVEKQSAEAPREYRKQEVGMLAAARTDAQGAANKHTGEMHAARKHSLTGVAAHQLHAKEEEEKKRAEIASHIEAIYQTTKDKVEKRLKQLDDDVNKTFDDGASGAQASFESYVSVRMDAYKDDRYGGWTGWARWGKDKLFGMPDEVNVFYQEGHDLYVKNMEAVIDRVAVLVETGLNEAMAMISAGKAEIDHYVNVELPSNLRGLGKSAASGIQNKFDALEQAVNEKQDQLVDSLSKKYNDNMEKLNSRIEEMKAANRGLVDALIDAIAGVIKTILALKDMLLNVISRAASAIGMIIAHPISFLGNLVDAGKQGFSQFTDHILEHLKQGFMEWLFGAVAETGIQLPKNFDLPGILSLVMQILGLTYSNIRSRAVKILGEKVVKALETAAEIFKILITKGPAGLWEYIKEKIGDLKTMVIEKIKAFVMEKIVIAGITWIIGLLNPASAFIKACKAIYDIIMFFVNHGKQILDLVNAIIDSITAIAKGQIAAAAAWVEKSLARTIPVIIGFLAALLGVGGISEKIKEIIEAIRKPINEAIDWAINKAVDLVKAVGGLLGFGKEEQDKPKDTQGRWQEGTKAVRAVFQKAKQSAMDKERVDAELGRIQVQYGFKELTAQHTGNAWNIHAVLNPEETIVVKDEEGTEIEFIVVRVGSEEVKVKLDPAGDEIELKKKMSGLKQETDLVEKLDIDKQTAGRFLKKLGSDWHIGQLLLSFAREKGGMPPEEFLETQLRSQRTAMAAIARPVAAETRRKLVYLGEEKAPLSNVALVYHEESPGQFKASMHPEARVTEYNYLEGGGRATANILPLCIVRVDDLGVVVDIISISPKVEGGRDAVARILDKAGWTVSLK